MIDFDALVNAPALQTFGEVITYTADGSSFPLQVVFDEAWLSVEMRGGRHGLAAPISTTRPCFGCRQSDFPLGVVPKPGNTITRNGRTRSVSDVSPDGLSGWYLISLK